MSKRITGLAEQLLIASISFTLILLVFDQKLVVPVWLQPVGRMHPLLLHFPIVLLLLAMAMEIARFRSANRDNAFYNRFLNIMLLTGSVMAGLTVIMGLFLAKEDGYEGQVVQWHKWTGVGVFFLSSLLYWSRSQRWYNARMARIGSALTVSLLLVAGHFGATLTHGDGYLTEPLARLRKPEPVPLEQAMVFQHVVQPIFEQKCVSCHNPEKRKGQLDLTAIAGLKKGGKSGALFISGRPDSSLLLERIHLPVSEKKHMPPTSQPQLTPTEMALLALWVKAHAPTGKKVIDLPAADSLRLLSVNLFKRADEPGDVFDFDPADDETIQELNTDYRSIARLSQESPALAVSLYERSQYSPEKLKELSPIKRQVVALNLTKLPVSDADVSTITGFENLRKLDLNFTDVTGKAIAPLSELKHLKTLTLAGTRVAYADLAEPLGRFPKLQTVALWNTALTTAEVGQLRKKYKNIQFIHGFSGEGQAPIQLNLPQLKNPSPIFTESLALQLKHPVKGVQIRYSTDGTDPDSLRSPLYTNATVLTNTTVLRAKAYKTGWLSSPVAVLDFYKSTYKPDSVRVLLPFNPVHQADGHRTFFDRKLGTFSPNSPAWANNWAGFKKHEMALLSTFQKPVNVRSVALRVMVEPETGIFPPSLIEVWGGPDDDHLKLLGTLKPPQPVKKSQPVLKAYACDFRPQPVSCLKIIARPLGKIPDWHDAKGKPALLLVDEVFVN